MRKLAQHCNARTALNKYVGGGGRCVLLLSAWFGSGIAAYSQTAILKQAGTPPAGSAASIIYETGNFIGVGTATPAGPLEVQDRSVSPGSAPNVANIVITQVGGGTGANCMAVFPNPPAVHCEPDNSIVVRQPIYSGSTITGYNQLFTVNRVGGIGIQKAPYAGSAITARGGWVDLERGSSSALVTPAGLRFRNPSGTINHRLWIDNSNQLTFSLGVDNVTSNVLKLEGGLWMNKQAVINAGSTTADALEVHGKSVFDGEVHAANNFIVGGGATMNNSLSVGSNLTVGWTATVGNTLTVGSDAYFGGTTKMGPLHVGYDMATPGNTPYPAGWYELIVWGKVLCERVKVTVRTYNDWSDYVFAKDYKLRPLSEVSSFIQEHKHLPDVPSAAEVVKDGVDLQAMDATLLRKVEELTLYVLAQQKEIEELKLEQGRRARKK